MKLLSADRAYPMFLTRGYPRLNSLRHIGSKSSRLLFFSHTFVKDNLIVVHVSDVRALDLANGGNGNFSDSCPVPQIIFHRPYSLKPNREPSQG